MDAMSSRLAVGDLPDLRRVIQAALEEDLGGGDVTTRAVVDADTPAVAAIVARQRMVVSAVGLVRVVFDELWARDVEVETRVRDGDLVDSDTVLVRLRGRASALLSGERTALNFLQHACGVATATRAYVDAAGGRLRIADTRKTLPGLRALERYAVRCGGGHNHRNDLGGGVLIKENHIRAAGGVTSAVTRARAAASHVLRIACEVETLAQLDEAIAAGADIVLLDNMSDTQVGEAVVRAARRVMLEVSGGITLERIPRLATLGVDVVSVGAITHSAKAADLSMLFDAQV